MNIIFIVHRFHPNLFYPLKSIVDRGNKVQIIVPKIEIYEKLIEDYTYIEPIKLAEDQLTLKSISNHFKSFKPDLIVQRYFEGRWLLFSIMARMRGIKSVTYDQSPQIDKHFFKQKFRPVKRLLSLKPLTKFTPVINKGIPSGYCEPFSIYIPFPIVTLASKKTREYFPDDVIRVLCVGKLGQKRKNHLLLLDALTQINGNCSLTFVGAGPGYALADKEYFEILKERCENSKLIGGVEIIMDLPYQEMLNLYNEHDILVMPSENEAHGQAILEGLAAGCAVISTDDCGASGYVIEGYNGLIFGKNHLNDLIEKLRFFIDQPNKIRQFGNNALDYIEKIHNPQVFVNKIRNLI